MRTSYQSWFYRGRTAGSQSDPFRALDELLASTPDADQHACELGCASCCHYPVGATTREIDHLVAALRRTLDRTALAQLVEAVRNRATQNEAESWADQATARRPCALLDKDGSCMGYEARPVACRGHASRCRAGCEAAFAGASYPPPAIDGAALAAAIGCHEQMREAGQPVTYELSSALARRLGSPRASLRGCKLAPQ